MTQLYARWSDGSVVEGPCPLPKSFGGVLNFHLVADPGIAGWFPWTPGQRPDYARGTHRLVARDEFDADAGTISQAWDVVALTEDEIAALPAPRSVSPLQMRKALRAAGLKPTVDAYVTTLSEEAQEAWEFCIEVRQDDPFIMDACAALNLDSSQKAGLFRLAATF